MATNKHGRKYTYKLAGTSILVIRIVLALLYLYNIISNPEFNYVNVALFS